MGDNIPYATPADRQLNSAVRFARHHDQNHLSNGLLPTPNEEEPYTIKCICGFIEDDGNTVLCENCNTWQHIQCYYFPNMAVPDVHQCIDCYPRILDSTGASHRQKRILEPLAHGEERKPKRGGARGGRKSKTKDVAHNGIHQASNSTSTNGMGPTSTTNGWPGINTDHPERRSGSPRGQQPPNKKLKTGHKQSQAFGPDPAAEGVHKNQFGHPEVQFIDIQSPPTVDLADCPPNYFSPDFIRTHQSNTEFTFAEANLYLDIGITNKLSSWLDDIDLFAAVTGGKTQQDVFFHFPQPIEELESPVKKRVLRDTRVEFHGGHPTWPYITVEKDLFTGDLVGELRGSIGLQEDYKNETGNHWEHLRHPEHFVFFHPILPIYIDCRSEGTVLRYVRRSCRPNTKLETIITGAREYRFCLRAIADIPAGSEITIAWDIGHDRQLNDALRETSTVGPSSKLYVRAWVETILAHFGGCACDKNNPVPCWMAHFDRRLESAGFDKSIPKVLRPGRKRGAAKKSPNSTGQANNSRASSETVMHDHQDAEAEDHMSSSHSVRSTSLAPGVQEDAASVAHELSARERRKLEQQEKLFDKLEHSDHHGQRRKKRSSGSHSTLQASSSNPHGPSTSSNLNPNTAAPKRRASVQDRSVSQLTSRHITPTTPDGAIGKAPKRVRSTRIEIVKMPAPPPVLVDAETQTSTVDVTQAQGEPLPPKRAYRSISQRSKPHPAPQKLQRRVSNTWTTQADASGKDHSMTDTADSRALETMDKESPRQEWAQSPKLREDEDTEMTDDITTNAPQYRSSSQAHVRATTASDAVTQAPLQVSHSSSQPPDPPWNTINIQPGAEERHYHHNKNTASMHVDIPPPTLFNSLSSAESHVFATPNTILSSRLSPSTFGAALSPSPLRLFPPPAPAVAGSTNSITQPSPIKKKMSLSDYMNKRKSETPALEKTLSQSHQVDGLLPGVRQSMPPVPESAIEESINRAEGGGTPPQ